MLMQLEILRAGVLLQRMLSCILRVLIGRRLNAQGGSICIDRIGLVLENLHMLWIGGAFIGLGTIKRC